MKKRLLTAIFLSSLLPVGFSQDKIITVNNDTINCKISKISRNTIFFELTTGSVKSTGELPLRSVLNYTVSAQTPSAELKVSYTNPFQRFRFGINCGPGYLLASSKEAEDYMTSQGMASDKARSYYRNLRWGLNANSDLTFLITPYLGAGIKYRFFNTANSVEGFFDPQDGVHLIYTTYQEEIYVNFIGAMLYSEQFMGSGKSYKLNSTGSFGLATYRNEAGYLNGYYLLTGKNFVTDVSVGFEYFINSWVSAGADLSAFFGSIRKMKITDGSTTTTVDLDKDNYENLIRLDLSIGVRLYFWNK